MYSNSHAFPPRGPPVSNARSGSDASSSIFIPPGIQPAGSFSTDISTVNSRNSLENKRVQRMTISDDRSIGSNLELRKLAALKERTEPPEPLQEQTENPDIDSVREPSTPAVPQERTEPGAFDIQSSTTPGRLALQEHRMQLMLLEQQNKKRKLVAREEQEIRARNTERLEHPTASSGLFPHQSYTRPTGSKTAGPSSNESGGDISNTSLKSDSTTSATYRNDIKELRTSLERQVTMLQNELRQLEYQEQKQSPKSYHVLYRIEGTIYHDPPEWTQGKRAIVSRLPVKNLDLFLERNKSILFIVFRDFTSKAQTGTQNKLEKPRHSHENIYPVNPQLHGSLEILLQKDWRYEYFLNSFHETGELAAPYLFMYHSQSLWQDILAAFSPLAQELLTEVARYVLENFGKEYAAAEALFARGKVSVDFVKYLFQPGDILVSQVNNQICGLMAQSWPEGEEENNESDGSDKMDEYDDVGPDRINSRRSKTMLENLRGLDQQELLAKKEENGRTWKNGSPFITTKKFSIKVSKWSFDGDFRQEFDNINLCLSQRMAKITLEGAEWDMHDLEIYPLRFASMSVVTHLQRRGTLFWQCRKRRLISYKEEDTETSERFMVDYHTFRRLHPYNRSFGLWDEAKTMSEAEFEDEEPPNKEFVYLVPLQTKGFNMRTKKWHDLNVDQIYDVVWNEQAFKSLVLHEDRKTKELIRALVTKQISSAKATDVISGKGNGLILLFHGGPGTGKTLTAEGVAEIAKKPLYRVTCGDVGTKAEEVEQYLESVLHLGKIWDCIVLLDEAEVFLERRSLDDLQRNALVSVFLRVIEYHEGILILTSNRVGTFDEAFRSRIQIAIHYPPLRAYQRRQIWENFFNRLGSFNDGTVDVDDLRDHLESLQELGINGRQIRNAITTARQYAEWKGKVMNYEHLTIALEVASKFDTYTEKLRGGFTDDQFAEDEGIR